MNPKELELYLLNLFKSTKLVFLGSPDDMELELKRFNKEELQKFPEGFLLKKFNVKETAGINKLEWTLSYESSNNVFSRNYKADIVFVKKYPKEEYNKILFLLNSGADPISFTMEDIYEEKRIKPSNSLQNISELCVAEDLLYDLIEKKNILTPKIIKELDLESGDLIPKLEKWSGKCFPNPKLYYVSYQNGTLSFQGKVKDVEGNSNKFHYSVREFDPQNIKKNTITKLIKRIKHLILNDSLAQDIFNLQKKYQTDFNYRVDVRNNYSRREMIIKTKILSEE